jgi:hypothetical protein
MSKPAPSPLPDLDDAEYAAKLRPLGEAVIPKSGRTHNRISDQPDERNIANTTDRESGDTDIQRLDTDTRISSLTEARKSDHVRSRISVAKHIEQIEQLRGPKRRFEFLIPVRVGEALAQDAAGRGQSAATRLLEILRDAGYPVIPEDFVDLRKEKGRGGQ